MAGSRLLEAAKLFSATRSIAKRHVALRRQQFDIYTRTSTLAKAVKFQSDRVTLTAQAAIALTRRFTESDPHYKSPTEQWSPGDDTVRTRKRDAAGIPREGTVGSSDQRTATPTEGFKQEHHFERREGNGVADAMSEEELDVNQEEAGRKPLSDETIPPSKQDLKTHAATDEVLGEPKWSGPAQELTSSGMRRLQRKSEDQIPRIFTADHVGEEKIENIDVNYDTFSVRLHNETAAYSSLPRAKIPKTTHNTQNGGEYVDSGRMNQDVYYNVHGKQLPIPQKELVPDQDGIPEGIDTDVFHSPRIARMLGGRQKKGYGLDLKVPSRTPLEYSRLQDGKDQDTFNVQTSSHTHESGVESPVESPVIVDTPATGPKPETGMRDHSQDLVKDVGTTAGSGDKIQQEVTEPLPTFERYQMRESRVPSSRLGRFWQFGGLAANMAFGAFGEGMRRVTGSGNEGSLMLSPGNLERLVVKLSRMRGAALKLGQMISFQDLKMLPAPIHEVLSRVQDSADYMPPSQRDAVLSSNLGSDWRKLFSYFQDVPIAAASIGQVHRATLAFSERQVAVKIQYPGVAKSIDSDLKNLSMLLTASRLLPAGLFLDKTIANARTELAWECDYIREAECCQRFGDLLADDDALIVPRVIPKASGEQVLTAELMNGTAVTKLPNLDQQRRDWIGTQILRLCLREMTEFKFMQTDPNWTNFLFNSSTMKVELLDFGASREYPEKFLTPYLNTLIAASKGDRTTIRDLSVELGYLTGSESTSMARAHVDSVMTLAEPFGKSAPKVYDFKDQTITDRVRAAIPVMVRERLAPPPEETYSLHRKLSGAFLLCARLGSRVPCRQLFEDAISKWKDRK